MSESRRRSARRCTFTRPPRCAEGVGAAIEQVAEDVVGNVEKGGKAALGAARKTLGYPRVSSLRSRFRRAGSCVNDPPSGRTWILEEVANGSAPEPVPLTLPAVLRGIVDQVTTLAERSQVGPRIVAGIVVDVSASEHDLGRLDSRECEIAGQRYSSPSM
jgi:hypothetical protein